MATVLALAMAAAALVISLTRDISREIERVVRVAASALDASPVKEQNVFCPDGYVAIGGGANVPHGNDTPGVAIYWSSPFGNGWHVEAQDTRRKTRPWAMTAVVVCARGRDVDVGASALPPETG